METEKQGFFSDRKPALFSQILGFPPVFWKIKRTFHFFRADFRAKKIARGRNILRPRADILQFFPTSSGRHFCFTKSFVNFDKILFDIWTQPSFSSFCFSNFCLCSCILAAEVVRNRTRDCFTSSRAAWTASSVRARASSA